MAKTYGQACPVAHALDLLGGRWSLLVVRDLRLGPKRFIDLAAGLPGIAPTVLTQRLRDLVVHGVAHRDEQGRYALTARGRDLEPVFRALADWGSADALEGVLPPDPAVLGLRRAFHPTGPPWTATVHLRVDREIYTARISDGELAEIERGAHAHPDTVLTGTPSDLRSRTGLTIEGDSSVARRFLACIT